MIAFVAAIAGSTAIGLLLMWRRIAAGRDDRQSIVAMRRDLETSEAWFCAALSGMNDGFALWDRDDRLVVCNDRYRALYAEVKDDLVKGAHYTALVRKLAPMLFPSASTAEIDAFVADRVARHLKVSGARDVHFPRGQIVAISESRTSDGGIVGIYRDVTAERMATRALAESEAHFRDGIEHMADGFQLWDSEERLVAWNARYEAMFPSLVPVLRPGMSHEELARSGLPRVDTWLTTQEVENRVDDRMVRFRRAAGPWDRHLPDGRIVEIEESRTPRGSTVSIYRDVTDVRRGVAGVEASEARFRDGIESLQDAFALWDRDDRLVIWNQRFADLFSDTPEIVRPGISLSDAFLERIARLEPQVTATERAERLAVRLERWRNPKSSWVWRSPSGHHLEVRERRTADGGTVVVYRDVTHERTLLDKLQQNEQELLRALNAERKMNGEQRRFVAMASHEFRTPLAIIDGATQRIASSIGTAGGDVARRLDRIRSAVSRMTQIIDRTLDSARWEEGRLEMERHPIDIAGLLHEVCDRQVQITPGFRLSINTAACDGVAVLGDQRLLEQVFVNIVSNAVKYSGRSRDVAIVATRRDGAVAVTVTDQGIGIDVDDVSRIGERFFRARTADGITGTGIGLHLVKQILSLHGGALEAISAKGSGSAFTVVLPIDSPPPPTAG